MSDLLVLLGFIVLVLTSFVVSHLASRTRNPDRLLAEEVVIFD